MEDVSSITDLRGTCVVLWSKTEGCHGKATFSMDILVEACFFPFDSRTTVATVCSRGLKPNTH